MTTKNTETQKRLEVGFQLHVEDLVMWDQEKKRVTN